MEHSTIKLLHRNSLEKRMPGLVSSSRDGVFRVVLGGAALSVSAFLLYRALTAPSHKPSKVGAAYAAAAAGDVDALLAALKGGGSTEEEDEVRQPFFVQVPCIVVERDPSTAPQDGNTCVCIAAANGQVAVISALNTAGASFSHRNKASRFGEGGLDIGTQAVNTFDTRTPVAERAHSPAPRGAHRKG